MIRSRTLLLLSLALTAGCAAETAPKASEFDATEEDGAIAAAEGAADSAQRPTIVGEIRDGETLEASFSSSSKYLAWYFDASAGQTIVLDARGVRPRDLDTVLMLYAATSSGRPSGASLASNDDWMGELSSHLEQGAVETRRYVAVVRRYDRAASGRVALSLSLAGEEGAPCGSRGLAPCPEGQFCNFGVDASCGATDLPGSCAPIPEVCPAVARPACGCDGTTYSNGCAANAAGVSVAHDGECDTGGSSCRSNSDCPALRCYPVPGRPCPVSRCIEGTCQIGYVCGGLAGFTCPDGYWCDYPDASNCGHGDQTGFCKERPRACREVYAPVCGCDARTYSNDCAAHSAGTDVSHTSACEMPPPPADCRTSGCAAGRTCQYCWTRWACIPDGAVC